MSQESVQQKRPLPMAEPPGERVHPGEILRLDIMPEMKISVSEAAKRMDVSRVHLHRILKGDQDITIDMAVRIGKLVGNGPQLWLTLQYKYDLWRAENLYAGLLETGPTQEHAMTQVENLWPDEPEDTEGLALTSQNYDNYPVKG